MGNPFDIPVDMLLTGPPGKHAHGTCKEDSTAYGGSWQESPGLGTLMVKKSRIYGFLRLSTDRQLGQSVAIGLLLPFLI